MNLLYTIKFLWTFQCLIHFYCFIKEARSNLNCFTNFHCFENFTLMIKTHSQRHVSKPKHEHTQLFTDWECSWLAKTWYLKKKIAYSTLFKMTYLFYTFVCSFLILKGTHTQRGQLWGPFPTASHRWSWRGCSLAKMSSQWGYRTDGLINGVPFSAPGAWTSFIWLNISEPPNEVHLLQS